jgi:pimeloyl-ACP methyl ester carboxylesterase
VDDLQALLGHVGVERAAVVGNSMAARIALEYALAHPEVVDRLVLIAGGLTDHEWSELQREADAEEERLFEAGEFEGAADGQVRFWVDGPGRGPDAVDSELREWSRSRILRSYELYREAARNGDVGPWKWPEPPAVERLGDVGVPTLIVVGEHDVVDLLQIADRLEAAIPGARKEIVADAAHLLPLEQPEAVNRLLLDFLGER